MTTDTGAKIVEFVRKNGRGRPVELVKALGITQAAIQRQLRRLTERNELTRVGSPPKVYYVVPEKRYLSPVGFAREMVNFLDENYLYVTPSGQPLSGAVGFGEWIRQIKQEKYAIDLAAEYMAGRKAASRHLTKSGWIDGTTKIKNTFPMMWVDGIFFRDFYSLPKFGKTKLGQMVMLAKTSGDAKLIDGIAEDIRPIVFQLIKKLKIEAVAFVPHSVPRKVQFNQEIAREMDLDLPEIGLDKAYAEIPIQQKSLSKLEERIENARGTIFVSRLGRKYGAILLIDDAVGSGATMNETAKKFKDLGIAKKVFGFAVVGSMKGFDVIPVV